MAKKIKKKFGKRITAWSKGSDPSEWGYVVDGVPFDGEEIGSFTCWDDVPFESDIVEAIKKEWEKLKSPDFGGKICFWFGCNSY